MDEIIECARIIEDAEKERKRDEMRRSATELHQYYRELMEAGFSKKQAMKIVVAAVGRNLK